MAGGRAAGWAAIARGLSSLVFLLDFTSCKTSSQFGTMNGNVTLSPSSTVHFQEILWKKGKNKVVEWELDHGVRSYAPFIDRVHLDTELGNLVIFNLTSSDEGEYEIESIDLTNGMKFNLTVLDPLPPPILLCTLIDEDIDVYCETPKSYSRHREQLIYEWHCRFSQCKTSLKPSLHEPAVLRFKKTDDLSEKVQCLVRNPESNRTSSIVLSSCVPDKSRNSYTLIGVPLLVICFAVGFQKYARKPEGTNSG